MVSGNSKIIELISNWEETQEAKEEWLDILKDNIKNISDKNLTKISKYFKNLVKNFDNENDHEIDLITMTIGICSNINDFDKIEFVNEEKEDFEKIIKINLSYEQIQELSLMGIHPFNMIQNHVINEISDSINKIIEENGKAVIYRFVHSVSTIAEGTLPPQIVIKSFVK